MNKRAISTIFLIVFIDLFGFGIILPLLPYIAELYHANAFTIGLIMAVYSLCQFIASPILGRLSDRHGRKSLLIISQLGSVAGYILLAVSHTLPLLFLSRVIDGLTGGNISVANAYVADITTPKNRAKGMGYIGAAFGLGLTLGPAIGGQLARISFAAPAYFAAAIGLLSALTTALFLKETVTSPIKSKNSPEAPSSAEVLRVIFKHPLGLVILTFFLVNFVFSGLQGTFALWAENTLHFGPTQIGFIFTYIGLIAVLSQLVLLPLFLKRFTERITFINSHLFLFFGLILIPFVFHLSVLIFAATILTIGMTLSSTTSQSIGSEQISEKEYGEVLGIFQSSASLGRIIGPIVGGFLFHVFSPNTPYIISALVMLLLYFILVSSLNREPAFMARLRSRLLPSSS